MVGRAVIIGGGIAGLATGAALHRLGWDVSIRERSTALPRNGTALGMWPEAMAALDSLGVGDRVRERGVLCRGGTILRSDGRVLGRVGRNGQVVLVSRVELLEALYATLPAGAVEWGAPLDEEPEPSADLVIGADGIRSATRARWWADDPVRPLGTVAYRGVLPGRVTGVTETWGRGALFGITPAGEQTTNWFAAFRLEDERADAREDLAAQLRRMFGSWHPAVAELVTRLGPGDIDRRVLYDVAVPPSLVRGRTVLVGDAAHAMAPNLGRGACESLLDAQALARELARTDDIPAALRRYDRARRARSRAVVGAARVLNRVATAPRHVRLRDTAARLAFLAA